MGTVSIYLLELHKTALLKQNPNLSESIRDVIMAYNRLLDLIEKGYLVEENMHPEDLKWLQSIQKLKA